MSEIEIIKHDVLKLIDKVEELEQKLINVAYKCRFQNKNSNAESDCKTNNCC